MLTPRQENRYRIAAILTTIILGSVTLFWYSGCNQAAAMNQVGKLAQESNQENGTSQKLGQQPTQQQNANQTVQANGKMVQNNGKGQVMNQPPKLETITLGAGCFWCVEAVFQRLEGVEKVTSGYCNGDTLNPTYEDICSGTTGHVEACQVIYDPAKISLREIFEVFWKVHDPTTLNRQWPDTGTQYRSGIYFHNAEQQKIATEYKEKLDKSGAWGDPIVTEIVPAEKFYPAEDYHQNYFNDVASAAQKGIKKGNFGYCARVIVPKIEKLEEVFADKLKSTARQKEAEAAKKAGATTKTDQGSKDSGQPSVDQPAAKAPTAPSDPASPAETSPKEDAGKGSY